MVNLAQFRHNKCKKDDMTSGRKRTRVAYVNVVPADNADPTVAEAVCSRYCRRPAVTTKCHHVASTCGAAVC